ncbi:MAG: helix-turn-helix transcriptional regulator [Desulfobacter sp.]|nr:MAG: helix-turn-helix transcriptional regulator [Desulfobacter sp.]
MADHFKQNSGSYFRLVLDSLSAHVAVLDKTGRILETNEAWKKFARRNDLQMRPDTKGINYLDVCAASPGREEGEKIDVNRGIRELIAGKIDEFVMEYACHSPKVRRWFYMRATRLELEGDLFIIISHENITALKQAQEELLGKEAMLRKEREKLELQSSHLSEANTALKVLLDQREKDKSDLEQQFLTHISQLVLPHLDQLLDSGLGARQAALARTVRSNLDSIASPFLKRLPSLALQLTPLELQVANLVKEGRTTKEIAAVLGSSPDAVDFHRKNIRKKFGLTGRKINLRTYLLSLK